MESLPQHEGFAAYRELSTDTPMGWASLAEYRALSEKFGDPEQRTPVERIDAAWLGLETTMAMVREPDPDTGMPFVPKDLNIATEQIRANFRAVGRDESVSSELRAAAKLGLSSVGMYMEVATGSRSQVVGKNHMPYLRGIQMAAREVLDSGDLAPEGLDLLNGMTAAAIYTEYALDQGWFLPASPRQPWQINGFNRRNGSIARISVGREPQEGVIDVEIDALGNYAWVTVGLGDSENPEDPAATIKMYTRQEPGYAMHTANNARSRKGGKGQGVNKNRALVSDVFSAVSDSLFKALNRDLPTQETPTDPALATTVDPEEEEDDGPKQTPEALWFMAQSAVDVRDIPERTLTINIGSLESAAAAGTLQPAEHHTLGWMQLDHGRLLTVNAHGKSREAEAARLQASRVARADAPAHLQQAEAADQAAAELAERSRLRFEQAIGSFTAALAIEQTRPGEVCEVLLDQESAHVYKALFAGDSTEELAKVTDTYNRRLAALYMRMRDAERKLKKGDQADAVRAAAICATFCLMLNGATDEAARHMALSASVRGGGSRGRMEAVVFPYNFMEEKYDMGTPVNVQLNEGTDITVERGFVTVGFELFAPKGNALPTMSKLASVIRANKPGAKKRESRGQTLDDLTMRLADAVIDASE